MWPQWEVLIKQIQKKNRVELLDASSQEVLHVAYPPRNDVAQQVSWNLDALDGRRVVLTRNGR